MRRVIFIDADILIPLFDPDAKSEEVKSAKSLLSQLKHYRERKHYVIRISQVALAEIFMKILRIFMKNLRHASSIQKASNLANNVLDAIWKISVELEADYPSLKPSVVDLAKELLNEGYVWHFNDALILAHAMDDRETEFFLTTDRNILESYKLEEWVNEYRRKCEMKKMRIAEVLP